MTKLLQQAFAEAEKLPSVEQDSFARWMLEELRAEERWQQAFANSQDALAQLAQEALEERRQGRTQPLDPDEL
ncbi:MAG: hypothetical protein HY741_04675 [Chloroflexi bacterium]|nr:hypothetical protein [Chloroflexota bacterium]